MIGAELLWGTTLEERGHRSQKKTKQKATEKVTRCQAYAGVTRGER